MSFPVTTNINNAIKKPRIRAFRKFYIKRRQISDGQFETDWQEMTDDVKRWASIRTTADVEKFGSFTFDNLTLVVDNSSGRYGPNDNAYSYWNGYGDQQRTLVKIECGFEFANYNTALALWQTTTLPSNPRVFTGIISGNIRFDSSQDVSLPIRHVTQVFRDYPATNLDVFTTTGLSAGSFIQALRDQTDGAGGFVFRPFFNNTTTGFSWATSALTIFDSSRTRAELLGEMDVWEVIQKLCQAEYRLPYVNSAGNFIFSDRAVPAAGSESYRFFGVGSLNFLHDSTAVGYYSTYGETIKNVTAYGKKLTDFYSRVAVKYVDSDTTTSFVNTALAFAVSGSNTAWNLGSRTFSIENFWLPNSAAAAAVASQVFSNVSSQKEQINFTTTMVPHLALLDRVAITYDSTAIADIGTFWDLNDWDTELLWDGGAGTPIVLDADAFQLLSIDLNLETFESKFIARKI